MKIEENELSHELELAQEPGGVSSFEDFWMFISFAMMVIVFALMGYVNYLNRLSVNTVKIIEPSTSSENLQTEAPSEKIITIYVHKNEDGVYLAIDEDSEKGIGYDVLAEEINKKSKDIEGDTVVFDIEAPGEYSYEDIMRVGVVLKSSEVLGPEIMGNDKVIKKKINFLYLYEVVMEE